MVWPQQTMEVQVGTKIYCCECKKEVEAELEERDFHYPDKPLSSNKFYRCPECGGTVGADENGTPYGTIPTKKLKELRRSIKFSMVQLSNGWKYKTWEVNEILCKLSGKESFSVSNINSEKDATKILNALNELKRKSFAFNYTKNQNAKVGTEINCYCGKVFQKIAHDQYFCSKKCKKDYENRKNPKPVI